VPRQSDLHQVSLRRDAVRAAMTLNALIKINIPITWRRMKPLDNMKMDV